MNAWVPLLQTLSWIGLIVFSAHRFSAHLERLFEAIRKRIQSGSSFKAGPIELGKDLKALEKIGPSSTKGETSEEDWGTEREDIYQNNNGLFIAHIIEPSKTDGQLYDIFIYLVRHKSNEIADIRYAEFYLGSYWDNKVFRETEKNGLIGISTSAYGPFLCTCRVKMKNNKEIRLHRYIDFEMGRVFKQNN